MKKMNRREWKACSRGNSVAALYYFYESEARYLQYKLGAFIVKRGNI